MHEKPSREYGVNIKAVTEDEEDEAVTMPDSAFADGWLWYGNACGGVYGVGYQL